MFVWLLDDLSLHLFFSVSVYRSAYAFRYISFNIGIIVRVLLFVCQSGISVYFSSHSVYCISRYLSIHLFLSLSAPFCPSFEAKDEWSDDKSWGVGLPVACCHVRPSWKTQVMGIGLLPIGKWCRRHRPKTGKSIRHHKCRRQAAKAGTCKTNWKTSDLGKWGLADPMQLIQRRHPASRNYLRWQMMDRKWIPQTFGKSSGQDIQHDHPFFF